MTLTLPHLALSIRQPWAWAIVHAGKDIENRSSFAVTKSPMKPLPISIHAAQGMTQAEYEDAVDFMARIGVTCPRPDDLVRGAVIGAADVTAVVDNHPSRWFVGPHGLVLANPRAVAPIPAAGKLSYFPWRSGGAVAVPLPWMTAWPAKATRSTTVKGAPLFDHFGREG